MEVIKAIFSPMVLFGVSVMLLIIGAMRKNNNYMDIKSIFVQEYKLLKNEKFNIVIFYVVPILLAIGIVQISTITGNVVENINIVITILLTVIFAVLGILWGSADQLKGDNKTVKVIKETINTVMFISVLNIFALILAFALLFVNLENPSIVLIFLSGVEYTLIFMAILHLFIVIKRMKKLIEQKLKGLT